ncbi:response regulator transcription factor [Martelella lutilitoris]|uniref:Response regulator transcription factor n=1 Tax=Martelella lutilitoris TaxID=2583532 RepID=A0A5C4JT21_9HYPH|nr:response regulator transcription factor [Martelella lutilitoris]TNB48467.1 response regulator transcription factor [Martelella lutilitoris]
MRVLLVEDNDELAAAICDRFRSDGHAIDREADGRLAAELLSHKQFDIVILDINLPGASGYDVLRDMRARKDHTAVLVLTARSEIDDRVVGLDAGADDYMVKPADFRELAARCRALARRGSGDASNLFVAGDFTFDRGARRASMGGTDLELRQREIQLLEALISNLGRVLSKEDVADRIYSFEEAPSLNALEQTVARLRKKLEATPVNIKTIRGLGYIANVRES